jgi:hypothetical protein
MILKLINGRVFNFPTARTFSDEANKEKVNFKSALLPDIQD